MWGTCNVANPWFHALPSIEGELHLSVMQINVEHLSVLCRSMFNDPLCLTGHCWTPLSVMQMNVERHSILKATYPCYLFVFLYVHGLQSYYSTEFYHLGPKIKYRLFPLSDRPTKIAATQKILLLHLRKKYFLNDFIPIIPELGRCV
jgi:hypothetical protein